MFTKKKIKNCRRYSPLQKNRNRLISDKKLAKEREINKGFKNLHYLFIAVNK